MSASPSVVESQKRRMTQVSVGRPDANFSGQIECTRFTSF